jgi:hypothetical protein
MPKGQYDRKKNLAPQFQPGNPGGPGRPPGSSYKTMVQSIFIEMMDKPGSVDKRPFLTRWMESFMQSAMEGGWASRILSERILDDEILDQIDKQLNKAKREDTDFLAYRIYKECHDIQRNIILSREHRVICMAGRRAGKTESAVRKGLSVAVAMPDARVLYVGLSFTRCLELFWQPLIDGLTMIGYEITEHRRTEGLVRLSTGAEFHFCGNTTVDERDKIRGSKWDLCVIDECQSQKALPMLIEEIIEPTLLDRRGQLMLLGTGPKVRGTYWEELWSNQQRKSARFNWNISDNPFIPDYLAVLEKIKEEKGYTDTTAIYVREYLGKIAYDDDALVYRLSEANTLREDEMRAWIETQPVSDIKFSAGLDYGFIDSDGFSIVMFSTSKPERWLVYEHKGNRTGVSELADKIREGMEYVQTAEVFKGIPDRHFYIYSDSGGAGKKISYELATQYKLPCMDAYKADKDFAVETLQEEVRRGYFKAMEGGVFYDEALKTVFSRNDRDELTRKIDDDCFHTDLLDSVLYAMRFVWINYGQNAK